MRQQATTLAFLTVCSALVACNGGEFTDTDWGASPDSPSDGGPSVDPLGGDPPQPGSTGEPGSNPGTTPGSSGGGAVSPTP